MPTAVAEPTETFEDEIIAVLASDPDCLRLMNAAAITEEAIYGDAPLEDCQPASQSLYDSYEAALQKLEEEGVIESHEFYDLTTYRFTDAGCEERLG